MNCKRAVLNLDLILDLQSIFVSAYKSFCEVSHHKEIKSIVENNTKTQGASLFRDYLAKNMIPYTEQDINSAVGYLLKTVKPQIASIRTLRLLEKNGFDIILTTDLDKESLGVVSKYADLGFPMLENEGDCLSVVQEMIGKYNDVYVFEGVPENLKKLVGLNSTQIKELILIKNKEFHNKGVMETSENFRSFISFEEVDWSLLGVKDAEFYQSEYILNLKVHPKNDELQHWNNVAYLDEPIYVNSDIVEGFGRGGRQLGIPTANLRMTSEIEEKLSGARNGVFFGRARFTSFPKSLHGKEEKIYDCVMSLGYNPYYENKSRTFEVHLMEDFDDDFYSASLAVEVLGYIRCQADMKLFDHLIKFIHNDYQVAKNELSGLAGKAFTC